MTHYQRSAVNLMNCSLFSCNSASFCGNTVESMLTSHQLRAARALLGWSARDLSERAGVNITTVQRMESREGQVRGNIATLEKITRVLETSGIEFLAEDDSQGVRLTGAAHGGKDP